MTIAQLVNAAKREEWNYIDSQIPGIVHDSRYVKWAYEHGLDDKDGNVRDLAASILREARFPGDDSEKIKRKLYDRMASDDNPYVRYRSAFALAHHGDTREEVVRTLEEAEKDKDVSEIAKGYLSRIKKS